MQLCLDSWYLDNKTGLDLITLSDIFGLSCSPVGWCVVGLKSVHVSKTLTDLFVF